jgi:hypothetical protein
MIALDRFLTGLSAFETIGLVALIALVLFGAVELYGYALDCSASVMYRLRSPRRPAEPVRDPDPRPGLRAAISITEFRKGVR